MEEGSDWWAPPVGDSGTRDPLVCGRREGETLAWEGKLGRGLLRALGRGERHGGKVLGLREDFQGEGGEKINLFFFYSKPISNLILKSV